MTTQRRVIYLMGPRDDRDRCGGVHDVDLGYRPSGTMRAGDGRTRQ